MVAVLHEAGRRRPDRAAPLRRARVERTLGAAPAESGQVRYAIEPPGRRVLHDRRHGLSPRAELRAPLRRWHHDQSDRRAVAVRVSRDTGSLATTHILVGVAGRAAHDQQPRGCDGCRWVARRAASGSCGARAGCYGFGGNPLVVSLSNHELVLRQTQDERVRPAATNCVSTTWRYTGARVCC